MAKKKNTVRPRPRDVNELAKMIVDQATQDHREDRADQHHDQRDDQRDDESSAPPESVKDA